MPLPVLVRSALFGVATGARSQLATAALAAVLARDGEVGADSSIGARAARLIVTRRGRTALALGAVGELIGDKLPNAPSRLHVPGLTVRLVMSTAGAAVLAERSGAPPRTSALVGGLAALATSIAGARFRGAASRRLGRDWPGALSEDAAAGLLTVVSVRGL